MQDVNGLLPALAAYGLPGTVLPLPASALPHDAWRRLLAAVHSHRLHGLVLDAAGAGALPTTAEQLAELRAAHAEAMTSALLLERNLLAAAATLDAAGLEHRVLKGPAVARLDYANPALRVFGDIDLLVPADEFDRAIDALSVLGYGRPWPQLRPGFDQRFGKGATLVGADERQLDLHRTFVMGPFGLTVGLETLFASAMPFTVGRRKLLALDDECRLLHACYHAALGDDPPRLVALRDVAQLVLATGIDSDRVLALAHEWGGQSVVARAIATSWQRLGLADVVPLTVWAQRFQPSRQEERFLAVYGAGVAYSAKALASLRVIRGATGKAAFLAALMFPERTYLRDRARSRRTWLGRVGQVAVARAQRS